MLGTCINSRIVFKYFKQGESTTYSYPLVKRTINKFTPNDKILKKFGIWLSNADLIILLLIK